MEDSEPHSTLQGENWSFLMREENSISIKQEETNAKITVSLLLSAPKISALLLFPVCQATVHPPAVFSMLLLLSFRTSPGTTPTTALF